MDKTKLDKLGYSIKEASEVTSLSKSHLHNEIRDGKLKVQRFGKRIVILRTDLDDYLKQSNK